jgi:hypothetical protein
MVEVSISRARRAWEAWCRTDSEPQRDLAGAKTYGRRSEEEGVYTQSLPLDPLPAQPFFVCFADCESKCAWASWQPGELIGTPISLAEAGIVDERALAAAIKRQYNFAAHEGMRAEEAQCSGAAYCCRRLVLFPTSHSQIARPVAVHPACSNCLRKVPTSMSCLRKNGTSLERRLCCVQATTGKLKLSQYCSRTVDLHHTFNLGSAYSCAAMHWYVAWDLPDRERVQENARREIRQLIDDFENREEI